MKMKPILATLVLTLGFLTSPAFAQTSTQNMIAAGSGVNLGITQILADAFMAANPNVKITVPGSIGTKGAIAAIADNAITFGLISRSLKEKEKSPDYTALHYATTPIVIGANPDVADDGISSQDVVAVYQGTKTEWSDGNTIVVQSREASDSGFMVLEKIPGFKEAADESRKAERWSVYFTDQDANKALAGTRFALGVTDLGMIRSEKLAIKPLKLDGIEPSPETLASGQYPLSRPLYILYREKTLPPEGKAFLEFIRSEQGAQILKEHGYIPAA